MKPSGTLPLVLSLRSLSAHRLKLAFSQIFRHRENEMYRDNNRNAARLLPSAASEVSLSARQASIIAY